MNAYRHLQEHDEKHKDLVREAENAREVTVQKNTGLAKPNIIVQFIRQLLARLVKSHEEVEKDPPPLHRGHKDFVDA